MSNPFDTHKKTLEVGGKSYDYFDIAALSPAQFAKLPYSIRVLLECAVRNCDGFAFQKSDVETILDWSSKSDAGVEIPFKPARVILQDFTGVPAVVDLAAMRDAMARLGGDPDKINPLCPVDLVIDHSVQVDAFRVPNALEINQNMEMDRNAERFEFLKWGSKAFRDFTIVPPGSGIVHQVNLEYLARVVFARAPAGASQELMYPDSLVGTDSHTTMINGLGVTGWGVGGIEAEAAMLGQPISMLLPKVVGYKLTGKLAAGVTSTDLVLTIVQNLRSHGVVGKFVEFFGPGMRALSVADRATIANMAPEYGATMGYFPMDQATLDYLAATNRDAATIERIAAYLRAAGLFVDDAAAAEAENIPYSSLLELDLSTVVPSLSGPKRPHDRVTLADMPKDFHECLANKVGFKGFEIAEAERTKKVPFNYEGKDYELTHGSVVIAAITSCTNTSNPSVMLGAGLLAKKAVAAGLSVDPYIKTSLGPGSGVVTRYLEKANVIDDLAKLGFGLVGYGCTVCIGNSGPLPEPVGEAITNGDLVACGVLSGNRNFEGRIHAQVRGNYLASPPLVVAYALAGRVDIDFEKEPLGKGANGEDVFLRDIWPTHEEIDAVVQASVLPEMFKEVYDNVTKGTDRWNALEASEAKQYPWNEKSTYIHNPPFFATMGKETDEFRPIKEAAVLLNLGDSITTDHISPAGSIARNSPAARYLMDRGVDPKQFNSYGSRRGNDEIMARGTFANIRLLNKFIGKAAPRTVYCPTKEQMDVFDAAAKYKSEGIDTIILGGADYGSGSSRDWAAKGPALQGVRAVIATSFERIHRSNLVGMGIIPFQYKSGDSADSLGLTGFERFTIHMDSSVKPGAEVKVTTDNGKEFHVVCRFDTPVEVEYFKNGGILHYVLRNMLKA